LNTRRLGCDIGGTFTDFVVLDDATGTMRLEKVLTTPDDPSTGIFNGIDRLASGASEPMLGVATVVHGTTLVINALIERKGSPTALITTDGFRDILEMRSELRYDVYDLQIEYPPPLVPRHLRFEVPERITADGTVLRPLDEQALRPILARMREAKIETVAVVLLHAYANPAHERQVAAWFEKHAPELNVSISSDVLPRIKEYERTSTTAANAYVKPKVRTYLDRLDAGLSKRDFGGRLYIMQSSGGVIEVANAKALPVRIIESGPAGGVAASQWWARHGNIDDLLCFDMGGTTAKLCAVTKGEALVTDEYEAARLHHFKRGSGLSVNVPVLDLLEIGTGGGSVARIDRLGLVKVGPESAGAKPGPACYGRGGESPTVTDADLVLGYLDPAFFLGGTMPLDKEASRVAIETHIAGPLGLSLEEAAAGIHDVANEDMAAAARLHLAERGQNAAALTMVAYGGAGPVHAYGLATKLGIHRILVPPAAGVMSALGMLVSNIAVDQTRTFKTMLSRADLTALGNALADLENEAMSLLPEQRAGQVVTRRLGELRYAGQGYNVAVPLPSADEWAQTSAASLASAFEKVYEQIYGRVYTDVEIELINLKVIAEVMPEKAFEPTRLPPASEPADAARRGERQVFAAGAGFVSCPVYDRYRLRPGHVIKGPAIIEERETSVVAGPKATVEIDSVGVLVLSLEA